MILGLQRFKSFLTDIYYFISIQDKHFPRGNSAIKTIKFLINGVFLEELETFKGWYWHYWHNCNLIKCIYCRSNLFFYSVSSITVYYNNDILSDDGSNHLYEPNIYIYIFSFQNKFLHSSKTWNTYFMSFSVVVDSTSQFLWQTVIYLHSLLRDHVNYWLYMQIQTNRSKDVNTYWPWRVNLVIH